MQLRYFSNIDVCCVYCRRYKTGYVWQDLLDGDLITPVSDNEYVIKGSEFYSTTSDYDGNLWIRFRLICGWKNNLRFEIKA